MTKVLLPEKNALICYWDVKCILDRVGKFKYLSEVDRFVLKIICNEFIDDNNPYHVTPMQILRDRMRDSKTPHKRSIISSNLNRDLFESVSIYLINSVYEHIDAMGEMCALQK